jgi:hypothetical protein
MSLDVFLRGHENNVLPAKIQIEDRKIAKRYFRAIALWADLYINRKFR